MTAREWPTETVRAEIGTAGGPDRAGQRGHRVRGLDRYARGDHEGEGSRNGHSNMSIKTTAGEVTVQRPKVGGTDEAFASRLLGAGVTGTNALESLVIAGLMRGLSVPEVEASLADALRPESTVSKSTVSRICEAIKDEFDTWRTRDLSDVEPHARSGHSPNRTRRTGPGTLRKAPHPSGGLYDTTYLNVTAAA